MNENIWDPQLRTFRMPITHRLRARIDELRDVIGAQANVIATMGKENKRLERELKKANRDLVNACTDLRRFRAKLRELEAEKGGNREVINSAETTTGHTAA